MSSFRVFNQQVRRISMAAAFLMATIVPALVPSLVNAATVTVRSIELSSSSKSATGVTYTVGFTPVANAGAFVVDFCSDSPVIGETCTPPAGLTVASAASTTSGFTDVAEVTNGGSHNTFRVTGAMTASTPVSVDVTGITNPSTAGPLYARILTYTDSTGADAYLSGTPGTHIDDGGVAISITDTVGVSGAVLESMTFCLSGADITQEGCGGTLTSPALNLGETVGTTKALTASAISTGLVYTQISTNAVGGAVVNLKSDVSCGGLKRVGAASCDIAPALTGGITAGQAKFGVKTATATTVGTVANGTLEPVAASGYNNSTYALNWVSGNATGVGSVYGDPFLDTNNAPINNTNMQLTFGASVANNTPAGSYSADLSMIATGKF